MPAFSQTVRTEGGLYGLGEISGPPVVGYITAPFKSIDPAHPTWHSGVDIGAPVGTPVLAAGAGTVAQVCLDGVPPLGGVFGNCVSIQHADGTFALYAHFQNAPAVGVGMRVEIGTVLGVVGTTGQSTGAHLHWGVAVSTNPGFAKEANGGLLDPLEFLGAAPGRVGAFRGEDLRIAAGLALGKFGEAALTFSTQVQAGLPVPVAQSKMDWLRDELGKIRQQIDGM